MNNIVNNLEIVMLGLGKMFMNFVVGSVGALIFILVMVVIINKSPRLKKLIKKINRKIKELE